MDPRKRAPAQFRTKRASIIAFLLGIAAVFVACGLLYRFVKMDYASRLPENVEQREVVPEEGYVAITRAPVVVVEATPSMRPIAEATPAPTKVPFEKYSSKAQQVVMPEMMFDTAEAKITQMELPGADEGKVMLVEGWGYVKGYDAQNSVVYLAVSPYHASTYRFYNVNVRTDFGSEFGTASGQNLQYAGFDAVLCVDTFEDGQYNLGVYVVNRLNQKDTVEAYESLAADTLFDVQGGKVTHIG